MKYLGFFFILNIIIQKKCFSKKYKSRCIFGGYVSLQCVQIPSFVMFRANNDVIASPDTKVYVLNVYV